MRRVSSSGDETPDKPDWFRVQGFRFLAYTVQGVVFSGDPDS